MLSLPRDRPHDLALPGVALAERVAYSRPMAIAPRGLHNNPSQMGVARLGDPAAPHAGPAGVLARHGAAVAHELPGPGEAGEFAHLGDDRHRRHLRDAAQRLERLDDGAHRGWRGLDRLVDRPLEPRDPLPRVLDLSEVVHARGLLRGLLELQGSDPASITLGPRLRPRRGPAPVAEQELLEPMPGSELIFLGGLARADQVAQRLVRRVRNPHRREIPAAEAPRQAFRIATVSLDAVAGLDRHQGR